MVDFIHHILFNIFNLGLKVSLAYFVDPALIPVAELIHPIAQGIKSSSFPFLSIASRTEK